MKLLRLTATSIACAVLTSCIIPGASGLQMVSEGQASAGASRLQSLEKKHPGLAAFLKDKGRPDFMLEARGPAGRGLMFYYLKPGKAWLMVWQHGHPEPVFLGPEPIQHKELNFLRAAKELSQP